MEEEFQQRCLLSFSCSHALFHFCFSCSAGLLPEVSTSAAEWFPTAMIWSK